MRRCHFTHPNIVSINTVDKIRGRYEKPRQCLGFLRVRFCRQRLQNSRQCREKPAQKRRQCLRNLRRRQKSWLREFGRRCLPNLACPTRSWPPNTNWRCSTKPPSLPNWRKRKGNSREGRQTWQSCLRRLQQRSRRAERKRPRRSRAGSPSTNDNR